MNDNRLLDGEMGKHRKSDKWKDSEQMHILLMLGELLKGESDEQTQLSQDFSTHCSLFHAPTGKSLFK